MTANPLYFPVFRAFDSNGDPLAGGKVYTYEAGTSTPKTSYTDSTMVTPNTNPVILDANGSAQIWISGSYKINLTDANDVQQDDFPVDNFQNDSGETGPAGTFQIVTAGGTVNAITADYTPNLTLSNLTTCAFVATGANTITTPTFAPDGLAAKTITKRGGLPLDIGDIPGINAVCIVEYNSANTRWELLNPQADNMKYVSVTNAVNEITATNAVAGASPSISATGTDTNIDLDLQAKGTGAYNFKATSTAASKIKLFEDTDNGTNSIAFKAPDSIASDVTFTVPSADGSSGQSLITNGSGVLSFASGRVVQVVENFSSSSDSTTSLIPYDNTIPQNTEGKEYTVTNLNVTPLYANSILLIEYVAWLGSDTNTDQILALFVDSTADAIAASVGIIPSANRCGRVGDVIKVNSGSTTARTYKLRYGGRAASTTYIGGPSGGPIMNGTMKSGIRVTEILV